MNLIRACGQPGPLMIVGDYPTKAEYLEGTAFNGSSGNLLDSLLRLHNWSIKRCYTTYVFKYFISNLENRNKKVANEAHRTALADPNYIQILKSEIEAVQPNVILGLGELALNTLTGHKKIDKRRGSIYPIHPTLSDKPIKVVCILSPRDIWQQNEFPLNYTGWDIGRAIKIKDQPGPFETNETLWIPQTGEQLFNYSKRALEGRFLTFDIETLNGFVTCISFSHNGEEAISVPLLIGPNINQFEKAWMYKIIQTMLNDPIPKVAQNAIYDITILERWGFKIRNLVGDTMLMASCIYPEYRKGLDFLTSLYTDYPYYKDEGKILEERNFDATRHLMYNAKDSLVTWQIWRDQQHDAEALNVKHFFFENVMPSFFTYKKINERGIRIDDTQRKKLLNKYYPMLVDCKTFISVMVGKVVNPLSPKQVQDLVYEELGCPKHYKESTNGFSILDTGEETLEEIYISEITDEGKKEILKNVILARKLAKVCSFLETPTSSDGRMRTMARLGGTETGRTSFSESLDIVYKIGGTKTKPRIEEESTGYSFQTIPKHGFGEEFGKEHTIGADLRTIYVPSPGYIFVEVDQGQAEARVVAVLSEDWEALELFDKSDIHCITAALVLGKKLESMDKNYVKGLVTKEERQDFGKKPRHAGNYDMGPGRLSAMTHFPVAKCEQILKTFHSNNPKIRGIYHEQIKEIILGKSKHIKHRRYLVTPHGRRRDFFGRVTNEMFKAAYANIPQAVVSDHTKHLMLRKAVEEFPEPLAYPLNEAHDSLMFEVKQEIYPKFSHRIKQIVETPIDFRHGSLPRDIDLIIPGEVSIGELSWGEMVEYLK